jgi:hypothetical protein
MHSKSSNLRLQGEIKMNKVHLGYKAFCVVILMLTFTSLAHATSLQTWVSGTGMNSGACDRLNPCATFQFALMQTTAGGEIDVVDAGSYGAVTINEAVTIDGTQGGGFASIIFGGLAGITINAGATDVVTLRNLSINGENGAGNTGITIIKAGTVHIENCVIFGAASDGIADGRSGNLNDVFYIYIKDTITRNGSQGININPGANIFVIASLTNVRAQDNANSGVRITSGVYASLDHCILSGNRFDGLFVFGNPGGTEGTATAASAHVDNTISTGNGSATGAGFHATDGGFIRLSNSTSYNNTTGLRIDAGGSILSYGTNRISGNTNGNGPPSGTISMQ